MFCDGTAEQWPKVLSLFIALWNLLLTFCVVVSWLRAMPSNCCVLICFHSYISCFDMLNNTTSAAEYTFLGMLEFGNFGESTNCKGQHRILWRRCHLFWKISLGLCTTANVVHRVSFSKVWKAAFKAWPKAGCRAIFFIISQFQAWDWAAVIT